MKRPLQLSLAIALALGGTNALALGLGPVHVNSKLNQPLDAEIPIIQGSAGEAEGLVVSLAAAEDFDRVGLNRARINIPLSFAVVKGSRGDMVIKVTSTEAVRDSFLDFLVEANWPKGRLLREYTVLLDPPVTAPGRAAATTPMPASPGTVTIVRRDPPPERTAAPPPVPRAVAPRPPSAAPSPKVKEGEYGPVEAGDTLSAVARAASPGSNLNQTMLALLKANPNAFYKDNINALKRGAILRVPSADEIRATASATEAAAQVQSQVEDWRGGRASPTLVADAGNKAAAPPEPVSTAKPSKTSAAAAKPDSRLELVPPKAGKDSLAMADRPDSGAGSAAGGAASTELKSELARTKETLTAREQESGELKSRVKELEEMKGKNDRLIGLKDSEIADLQRKLKEMQASSGKSVAATTPTPIKSDPAPAASSTMPPPAKPDPAKPTTKDEIWGKETPASAVKEPTHGDGAAVVGAAAAGAAAGAMASPSSTPPPMSSPSTPPASTPPVSAPSSTPPVATTPPSASASAPGATASTPSTAPAASAPGATVVPATPPAASTTPGATTPPSRPEPVKTKPRPVVVETPWYEADWVKPAAIGAGVLVLLLGFLGLRKRKPAPVATRGSIADSFGDSPLDAGEGAAASAFASDGEEASLREQLRLDPANIGLHLELLSLYYAERETGRFEDAAADMHAYVTDAHQPEWLEAQAMGQELAPHNPLFGGTHHYDDGDGVVLAAGHELHDHEGHHLDHAHADHVVGEAAHDRDDRYEPVHHDDFVAPHGHLGEAPSVHVPEPLDSDFEFDLDKDRHAAPAPYVEPAVPVAKHDEGFDFDLPPLDFDAERKSHETAAVAATSAGRLDDDYFPGEDAIGTKLDLAKAYMDMGDPEGARSMLEEVMSEGSEAQKTEAHRLMAEIR